MAYDKTRLTMHKGEKMIAVEAPSSDIDYTDFMELVEMLISRSGYTTHEIETYIIDWAADIKSKRSN